MVLTVELAAFVIIVTYFTLYPISSAHTLPLKNRN